MLRRAGVPRCQGATCDRSEASKTLQRKLVERLEESGCFCLILPSPCVSILSLSLCWCWGNTESSVVLQKSMFARLYASDQCSTQPALE
eukprot:1299947-Amphidinium_carterae.1